MFEKLMFWKKEEPDFGLAGTDKPIYGEEPKFPGLDAPSESTDLGGEPVVPGFGAETPPAPSFGAPPPSPAETPQAFGQAQQYQPVQEQMTVTNEMLAKDIALLSSKIDTLRVQLDNISQRVSNIERVALDEETRAKSW